MDDGADLRGARARPLRAQHLQRGFERVTLRLRHDAVDVARHLPDLRGEPAHGPEDVGRPIRGRLSVVVATEHRARAGL